MIASKGFHLLKRERHVAEQLRAIVDLAVMIAVHGEKGKLGICRGPCNLFLDTVRVEVEEHTIGAAGEFVLLRQGHERDDDWRLRTAVRCAGFDIESLREIADGIRMPSCDGVGDREVVTLTQSEHVASHERCGRDQCE